MKVLFVALLFVAGAFARSAVPQMAPIEGPECPIEDPLVREGDLPINVTLDPLTMIIEGSVVTDLKVEGLSTLRYMVNLNVILLSAAFELNVTTVSGNATYQAEGYVDARPLRQVTLPSGNFTGSGFGKAGATNVKVKGNGSIFLTPAGRVQLSRLALLVVEFDSLTLDLGAEFVIGGETIDWAEHNRNVKSNFDQDFAQYRADVQDKIRAAANNILKNFTLQELIDLIGGGDDGGDGGECEQP